MTDADNKIIDEFGAKHAGKSAEEIMRLALEELPADLLERLGAEEMVRWALEQLPEEAVLTKEDESVLADGLVEIVREAVRGDKP